MKREVFVNWRRRPARIVMAIFLLYVMAAAFRRGRTSNGFRIAEFGRLPIRVNGRVQPIDSAARIGLLQIRGTLTVPPVESAAWNVWKERLGATEWLLELLAKPDVADTRRIFPVEQPALRGVLKLATGTADPMYLSFEDLQPKLEELGKQAFRINKRKHVERAPWEHECLKLRNALVIYERLKRA